MASTELRTDPPSETRVSRRLQLDIADERMTITVPRASLAAALGFFAGLILLIAGLALPYALPKPLPTHATPPPPGWLTPLVPFANADSPQPFDWRKALDRYSPLLPVPIGFLVFLVCRRVLRVRFVLDKRADALSRGGRKICALHELIRVDIDDAPRIYVMNSLDLVVPPQRRVMLLVYDPSTDAALYRKAEMIAKFAGVPLVAKLGVRPRRN